MKQEPGSAVPGYHRTLIQQWDNEQPGAKMMSCTRMKTSLPARLEAQYATSRKKSTGRGTHR